MKILLLSQFFSTTKGGGEYVFSIIAKKLAENEHEVWVITNKIKDENYVAHKNIKLIFVPPDLEYKGGLPPSFIDNIRYIVNAVKVGLKILRKENIDLIHSNNFSPALGGGILSFLTSKPHVTSIWDIFSLCGKGYWKKWAKQEGVSKIYPLIGPLFEKFILKMQCKAIHTISDASKEDLQNYGAKKPIWVIPPSIETIQMDENQISKQFVYIGRLVFYKNLLVLLKAINIINKIYPEIKLVIVGGGPEKKNLMNLVKEMNLRSNIEFKGYVSAEEKTKLLSQSQALLFPSLCEGFGLVILEAFSQKKPVLVSNIRPMSDIVSHNETGYVLDPHNENEWAQKMVELIKNPDDSIKMGRKGNEIFEKNYNMQNMYEKIINMYEKIIEK